MKKINQDLEIENINNHYFKKQSEVNYKKFKEITEYDFTKMVIKKNVGNEARTFNIINQSKPLLSPSRISKVFTEHIFWNIPYKTLLLPRLMGQLVHKFLELRMVQKTIVVLTKENLETYTGNDYLFIIENWNNEKIDTFIEEVNEAVSNIYNYLNLKKIKILECEKYVCNYDYHGFIDMVAYRTYNDNGSGVRIPMIIDLKITSNEEIISSYYLQLSIYRDIYKKTAQCFVLFYNRNTKTPRIEKASWKRLDETFEMIDRLNKYMRS